MVGKELPKVVSALITPMREDRSIDPNALERLVAHEINRGCEGFYCCGSSGEGLLLSVEERMLIASIVSDVCKDTVPFYVHTGALGTREAIELSVHAQEIGAEAVSLIPPIYYHYSQEEVEQYYLDVAKEVDLGVIVYNIPQFTGISFSKESKVMHHEKIVGIKHTSSNLYDLERLSQAFPEKILFNGFDEIYLYSLVAGAHSTIGTTVNIFPQLFKAIRQDFLNGDSMQAQQKQHVLNDFIELVLQEGIFPSVKYCMSYLGIPSGPCRKPFKTLDDGAKQRIRQALIPVEKYL